MVRGTIERYEFIFAITMGVLEISESCCYLGKEDLAVRRKLVEEIMWSGFKEFLENQGR
jgi:hypothetical protein